jgi:hypothetical protein
MSQTTYETINFEEASIANTVSQEVFKSDGGSVSGWTTLRTSTDLMQTDSGYFGAIYQNNADPTQIMIGHRGTDGLTDLQGWTTNFEYGAGELPQQMKDGASFTQEAQKYLKREYGLDVDLKDMVHAGWSEGGTEAKVAAVLTGGRAYGFNSPKIKQLMDKIVEYSSEFTKTGQPLRDIKTQNYSERIVDFDAREDKISDMGEALGTRFELDANPSLAGEIFDFAMNIAVPLATGSPGTAVGNYVTEMFSEHGIKEIGAFLSGQKDSFILRGNGGDIITFDNNELSVKLGTGSAEDATSVSMAFAAQIKKVGKDLSSVSIEFDGESGKETIKSV